LNTKKLLYSFFRAKWIFEIPKKKKYLIIDNATYLKKNFFFLFKSNDYDIFYTRFEKINLYILLYTFLKDGLSKIVENYKKNYLNFIKPKIVYCALDQYVNFFFLKKLYPKAIYISDQHGIIKENGKNWPNNFFYRVCVDYKKKNGFKPEIDIGFVFNDNEKFWMSKIVKGNFYSLGSTQNNYYVEKKENKSILFISSGLYKQTVYNEKIIFQKVYSICEKNNLSLSLLGRGKDEKKHRLIYGKGKWTFIKGYQGVNVNYSYKAINSFNLIIFSHSTLGLEALSKKKKCLILLSNWGKKQMSWKFKKNGSFWTSSKETLTIEKLLLKIYRMNSKKFKKKSSFIASKLMKFDYKNKKKKKKKKKN